MGEMDVVALQFNLVSALRAVFSLEKEDRENKAR
jgi:hypothetical protein